MKLETCKLLGHSRLRSSFQYSSSSSIAVAGFRAMLCNRYYLPGDDLVQGLLLFLLASSRVDAGRLYRCMPQ